MDHGRRQRIQGRRVYLGDRGALAASPQRSGCRLPPRPLADLLGKVVSRHQIRVKFRGSVRSRNCPLPPEERFRDSSRSVLREQGGQFIEPGTNPADPVAVKRRNQIGSRLRWAGYIRQRAAQAVGLAIAGICRTKSNEKSHVHLAEGCSVFLAWQSGPLFLLSHYSELAARIGG